MDDSLPLQDDTKKGRRRRRDYAAVGMDTVVSNPFITSEQLNEEATKDNEAKIDGEANQDSDTKLQAKKINKVTFEVPILIEPSVPTEEDESKNDLPHVSIPNVKTTQKVKCAIHCFVPPSEPNGRWTGSVSGNTSVEKMVGSSGGSMELSCKVSSEYRLMGGCEIHSQATARPVQAHVGGEYVDPTSKDRIQVIAKQHSHNSLSLHCLTREIRDPWINSSRFSFYTKTREWSMFFTATSMTTHVLRIGCGLSSASTVRPVPVSSVQFSVDPELSSNRRAPISVRIHPTTGAWQGSFAFRTSKPPGSPLSSAPSLWSLGIQRGSPSSVFSRWSFVLAWHRGDVTLRIPILLGTLAGAAQQQSDLSGDGILKTATPYLILTIVGVANEMLSRWLWGNLRTSQTLADQSAPGTLNSAKARSDAASQQQLMKPMAESRTTTEREKGGLVIESATYQLNDEKWDVTTPLRFWVNTDTSSMQLAAGSKQHLLGFYPLGSEAADKAKAGVKEQEGSHQPQVPWWKEYWTPTSSRKRNVEDKKAAMPTLTIKYSYTGKACEAMIKDEDALSLPQQ